MPRPQLPPKPFITDKPPLLDINADDDPDMPYSGGSSAAFVNDDLNRPAEKVKQEHRRQRSELLPVANDIFKFVDEEKFAVGDIRSYMSKLPPGTSGIEIKDEYRGRELYLGFLGRFEQWMENRLSKTTAKRR